MFFVVAKPIRLQSPCFDGITIFLEYDDAPKVSLPSNLTYLVIQGVERILFFLRWLLVTLIFGQFLKGWTDFDRKTCRF